MEHLCLYASKPCFNTRSLKPDGEFHRFCDHHRAKAIESQRRWQMRRLNDAVHDNNGELPDDAMARRRNRKIARPTPLAVGVPLSTARASVLYRRHRLRVDLPPTMTMASFSPEEQPQPFTSSHDMEPMSSLGDEEIASLLESIVHGTINSEPAI